MNVTPGAARSVRAMLAAVAVLLVAACGQTPATPAPSPRGASGPGVSAAAPPATPAAVSLAPTAAAPATPASSPSTAASLVVAPLPDANWPMLRGGPSRDGQGNQGPVGNPVLRWRFQASGAVPAAPVAVGSTVYAISDDGVLHALDIATGSERWTFSGALGGDLGAAVVDGFVYVTDGPGVIHAVDAATGAERWHSSSAVPGGFVVAAGGVYVSSNGAIVGLDSASGAERWRYLAPNAGTFHKPAYAAGVVYAGSDSGGFVAVDAGTGRVRWQADTGTDGTGTAVESDGTAYLGDNGDAKAHLYAFDATSGTPRWKLDEAIFSPAVAGGIAYSGGNAGYISAHEVTTGRSLWRFPIKGEAQPIAVAAGVVFVPASEEHRVYALDAASGRELWQFDVDGSIEGSIAVTGSTVYVGTSLGGVYAIGGDGSSTITAIASPSPSASASPSPGTTAVGPSPCPPGPATGASTALPDGAYRTDALPAAMLEKAMKDGGVVDPAAQMRTLGWASAGTVSFTVCAFGGQWHQYERIDGGRDNLGSSGTYVLGDDHTLIETDCCSPGRNTFEFSLDGDDLTLKLVKFEPKGDETSLAATLAIFTSAPFTRQGGSAGPASVPNPFTVAGTREPAKTGLVRPAAIAVGPDGNLYVADLEPRIRVISPSGAQIRSWGKAGNGPGEFNFGDGRAAIAVGADGLVYVGDGANSRVQVFTGDGRFVRQFGSFGTGPGQFARLFAIAVDASANVYAVDDTQMTLTKFNAAGKPIWAIGGPSEPDPDLTGHFHLGAFDSKGRLWFANDDAQRVVAIDTDGHKVDAFGTATDFEIAPIGIVVDGADNVYVWNCSATQIQVFGPDHQLIGRWSDPGGLPIGASFAFGHDGRLYGIAGGDRCAGQPAPEPAQIVVVDVAASGAAPAPAFLWAATADGLSFPNGMAIAPDGRLWVADTGNSRFAIFTPEGKFVEYWGRKGTGDGEFDLERANGDGYGDIEFAPDGSFYVLDAGNRRIDHFDKERRFLRSWGGFGTNPGQFVDIVGLVVDPKGVVYALDDARNVVERYDAGGKVLGSFAPGLGGVNSANALAVDSTGNVYISFCCGVGNTVRKFDPSGKPILTIAPAAGGEFTDQPGGLSIDTDQRVFVPLGKSIAVFDREGIMLASWGTDRLQFPVRVLLDGNGNAYVTDAERNEVVKYRLPGDLAAAAFDRGV